MPIPVALLKIPEDNEANTTGLANEISEMPQTQKKRTAKKCSKGIGPKSPVVYLSSPTKSVVDAHIATNLLEDGTRRSADAIISKALEEYTRNHYNSLYVKYFKH